MLQRQCKEFVQNKDGCEMCHSCYNMEPEQNCIKKKEVKFAIIISVNAPPASITQTFSLSLKNEFAIRGKMPKTRLEFCYSEKDYINFPFLFIK